MRTSAASRQNCLSQIAVLSLVCVSLASCGRQVTGERYWKDVSQLTGGTMEVHFVVIDPKFVRDRKVYEDASEAVCTGDICQIGFFKDRNDVPIETMTADFFDHGGWDGRHEVALFFRNTNSGLKTLQFDCSFLPQQDLDSCLTPVKPSPEAQSAAQARGPLVGFGKAKFGMTTSKLTAALGGPDNVYVLNPTDNRTVLRTKADYHGRTYNAFYNITATGFSTVLMQWSALIDNDACAKEAKKIAADVSGDFGKEDDFSYYDAGGKTFRYRWLFSDGRTVELDNLGVKDGDCTLSLNFSAKGESN
ncbi:MAG: hypothetical protein KGJ49_00045 [Alphaproteobacteria bacterium]|nr:hypothetical protein [Alphaproteobacteria bacterium]